MQVLVIHPQASALESIVRLLRENGHDVVAARAVEDGVVPAPFMVVGGADAAGIARLRAQPGFASPAILAIVTGADGEAESLLESGVDDVILETAPPEVLLHRIRMAARLVAAADARAATAPLLEDVARATSELVGDNTFGNNLARAMAILGHAVDVDRVYAFRNHPHSETGETAMSQVAEWVREPWLAQIDNPMLQDLAYSKGDFARALAAFEQDATFQGITRELEPHEQAVLELQDIKSVLVLPVHVEGELWGFIGFDDCRTERRWDASEIATLRLVATAVGRAVERAAIRAAVDESEERYRSLLEQLNDIVYRHDLDGRFTEVNEKGAALLGYTRREFLRLSVQDVLDASAVSYSDEMSERKLRGEDRITSYETLARHKDGSLVYLETNSRLVYQDGVAVAVEGVSRDISERRAADARLEAAEQRNRALLDAFPDFVFRVQRDGRIVDYRPGRGAWSLRHRDDVVGRSMYDIAPTEFADQRMELVEQAIETGDVQHNNYTYDPGDGVHYCESRIVASGPDEVVIFVQDITGRRDAERQARRAASEFEALYVFGERLRNATTPGEMYNATVEALQATCETQRASVRVLDDAGRMPFVAAEGVSERYQRELESLPTKPVAERLMEPLVIDDVPASTGSLPPLPHLEEMMLGEQIHTYIGAPMIAGEEGGYLGQVSIYFDEPGQATPERVRLVRTIADTAALAINRVRAAEATRESEERFRTIFEGAPEAVALVRISDRSLMDVNERFFELTGYSRAEAVGRFFRDLHLFEDPDFGRTLISDILRRSEGVTRELAIQHRSGQMRECLVTLRLVRLAGEHCILAIARDITERKRREDEIARLAAIVESTDSAVVATSTDGVIISANAACEAIYGYAPGDIVGAHIHTLIPEEELETDRAMHASADAGQPASAETRRRRADGSLVDVSLSLFVLHDREGNRIGHASIAVDITERKRREAETARLAAVVDSSSDAIILYDPKARITGWNPAAEALFGYTAEEMVGGDVLPLLPADEHTPASMSAMRQVIEGSVIPPRDVVRMHKDGTPIDVSVTTFPVRDGTGAITGLASIIRDIRERKRREAEVARLVAAIESSQDAIITFDEDARVTSWNDGATQLLGYERSEMVGKRLAYIIPPDMYAEAAASWQQVLDHGRAESQDTVRIAKDGSRVDVSYAASEIRAPDGTRIGFVAIGRDIRERKRAEHEIARLAAAVESSHDAIVTFDLEGRVRSWNRGAERLLGYTASEAMGWTMMRFIPDDQRRQVLDAWQELIDTGKQTGDDTVQVAKDGTRLAVSYVVSQILSPEGTRTGYVGIVRDIGERKRREEELARMAAAVEYSIDPIMTFDLNGLVTTWNRGASSLFGYTLDEVAGLPVIGFIQPAHRRVIQSSWEELRATGRTVGMEVTQYAKDGTPIDIAFTATEILSGAGERIGYVSISRDIRARKAAEAEIARLAAVVESSDDAIYAVSDDRVVIWNPAAEQLFGYTHTEMLQLGILALFPDEDVDPTIDVYRRTLRGEPTPARETVRLAKDGTRIDVSVSWFPVLDSDGQTVGAGAIVRDIREQKAAQLALQQAQERLRAIVSNSPIAVFAVDQDGILTFYEGEGLRSPVLQRAKILRRHFTAFADYMPGIAENARRALAGEAFVSRDRIGSQHYDTHHTPTRDADGTVSGFFGVTVDVTDRVEAEQARRDAEALVRNVTENMPVVAFAVDAELRYVFVEGRPLVDVGLSPELVVGKLVHDVVGDSPDYEAAVSRAIAGEASGVRLALNGRTFDVALTPWIDADDQIRGAIGAGVDITERIESEEARQRAEELLHNAAANAPVGLVALTQDGTILVAEGRVIELLGFNAPDIVGHSFYDIVPAHGRLRDEIARIGPGDTAVFEFPNNERHFAVHVKGLEGGEGRPAYVGIIVDVTDRARAEEALLQAQKLESLAVLAGGIAHDFNNLLVGILGNAGLALSELPPESPARETIEDIETAGRRAAELARQMLAYSGKGRFVIQDIDLSALVGEMTHLLRAYTRKAAVRFDLASGLAAVEADATQLRQVIMNLVINAADAVGDDDGVIAVSTGVMEADAAYLASTFLPERQEPGTYAYLEVSDTGHGMDPETLARIFDPFFTTKFTGKGLGLAAVLGIVRGHKGAIRVDSTPGQGTTFRLLLPVAAGAAAPATPAAPVAGARWKGSGTVLLADDEGAVRMVATRALRAFGFEVVATADGQEALEAFEASPGAFVAVLADVTMPRLSGTDLADRVRTADSSLPIILMSGFNESDAVKDVATGPMVAFVQKPFDIATLRDTMQRLLDGPAGN